MAENLLNQSSAPFFCSDEEKEQAQAAATELLDCKLNPELRRMVLSISVWFGRLSWKQAELISDLYVKFLGSNILSEHNPGIDCCG